MNLKLLLIFLHGSHGYGEALFGNFGSLGNIASLGDWFSKIKTHVGDVASNAVNEAWNFANGSWHKKVTVNPQYIQSMGDVTWNGKPDKDGHIYTKQTLVTFRYYEGGPAQTLNVGPTTPATTASTKPPFVPVSIGQTGDDLEATLMEDEKEEHVPTIWDDLVGSDASTSIVVCFKLGFGLELAFVERMVFDNQLEYLERLLKGTNVFDGLQLGRLQSIEISDATYTQWKITQGPVGYRKAMNTNVKLSFSSGLFPDNSTFTVFDDTTTGRFFDELVMAITEFKQTYSIYFDQRVSPVTSDQLTVVDEYNDNGYQLPESPCFSDECWYYDASTDECHIKPEAAGHCYDLMCAHDSIQIKFSEKFFGIGKGEAFPFEWSDDPCYPKFNSYSSLWEWDSELGSCGMDVGRLSAEARVAFNITLDATSTTHYVDGYYLESHKARGVLNFDCTYLTSIELTADTAGSQAHGVASASGHSLAYGFTIAVHTDSTFEGMKLDKVKMGAPLFVEVHWTVTGLAGRVEFVVKECKVKADERSLAVVKDNCYSETVKAALISATHTAQTISSFKYETFTFQDRKQAGQVLECSVELCLAGEDCVNRVCNFEHHLKYSLFGLRN